MATYNKNFIKQVTFRISFDSVPLQWFFEFMNEEKRPWHTRGQQEIRHDDIELTMDSVQRRVNTGIVRVSDDRNGLKIQVSQTEILMVFDEFPYSDHNVLLNELQYIEPYLESLKIKNINSFYLRYLNEIDAEALNIGDSQWEWYISESLIYNKNFANRIWNLRRNMTQLCLEKDWYLLTVKYGIWNRFFPNPLIDKNFILDIEASSLFPIDLEENQISSLFKQYKESINMIFESAITEQMKNYLSQS